MDESQRIARRLLVPRSYSSVLLELVEQALGLFAIRIEIPVDLTLHAPVLLARNYYIHFIAIQSAP